jgi:hypothetical protein
VNVSVPEAPVDEQRDLAPGKHKIRDARKVWAMNLRSEPEPT